MFWSNILKLTTVVVSFQGENGMLELFLTAHTDTFEVSPSVVDKSGQFAISVKNNKKLDFEKVDQMEFEVSPSF